MSSGSPMVFSCDAVGRDEMHPQLCLTGGFKAGPAN